MSKYIFDLEQQILEAWRVVDDIEIVYHGMDNMDEDQQMNVLLGVEQLYRLKFEKLWETFEKHVQEFHAYRKEAEQARASEPEQYVPPAGSHGFVPDAMNIDWKALDEFEVTMSNKDEDSIYN